MGIETDPGEKLLDDSRKEGEEFDKYLKKWARRLHKGQISFERWNHAFQSWHDQPFAARMMS